MWHIPCNVCPRPGPCSPSTPHAVSSPRLVSAAGEELPIVKSVKVAVKLSGIVEVPERSFIVVEQLISQVILWVVFLQQQGLVLDFTTSPVSVSVARQGTQTLVSTVPKPAPLPEPEAPQQHSIWKAERERRTKVCIVVSLEDPVADEADECVIPFFNELAEAKIPGYVKTCFEETVQQARDRFIKIPGQTTLACHHINMVGSPARVPPRRIPAHFKQEVQEQMNDMLRKGRSTPGRRQPIVCGLPRGKQEDEQGCLPTPLDR